MTNFQFSLNFSTTQFSNPGRLLIFLVDRRDYFLEDKGEFMAFFPEFPNIFFLLWKRFREETEPILRFFRFLLADEHLVPEVLFRTRIVRLAVIRADTRRGPDDLVDERVGYRILLERPAENDHILAEDGGAFFEIEAFFCFGVWKFCHWILNGN
jgi:hypothetical protein